MRHSIQNRLVLWVAFCSVVLASMGLLAFLQMLGLVSVGQLISAILGLSVASLGVLGSLTWLVLRPMWLGLSKVHQAFEHPERLAELDIQSLPESPTQWRQMVTSMAQHLQSQQAAMQQVGQAMAALQHGQPSPPQTDRHSTVSGKRQYDSAQLLTDLNAGMAHFEALMAELHRSIESVYSEVHDTAVGEQGVASAWRDDPLLGPALTKIGSGHVRLLKIVHDMTLVVERSSITLADLSWQANTINQEMKALAIKGAQISASSQSLSVNSNRVSADAASVAKLAQASRESSQNGQVELNDTIESMRQMGARTQQVSTSITGLQVSSQKIEHIVQLIRDIANKINLLSLNAAIEAARAGEHGKGFAVVSDEVRKLAEKTFEATQEIDASVGGIMSQTGQAVSNMNELLNDVQSNVTQIEQVGQRLSGILNSSSELSVQMDGIVMASSQSAQEVTKISNYLGEIQDELASFGVRIESQEQQTLGLTELSEGFYEKLVELNLNTIHKRMFQVARSAADAVQTAFESAIAQGQISPSDLLSAEHHAIVNTHPTKYDSRFDAFTDRVLPAIQERVLQLNPELIFAICTNKRGYVPTHNDKFAHPLTGVYEVDLLKSRSKRIFSDRTGSRCGSHTRQVLLQTYKRDTGEIMHDLSVPIMVGGQHWGGFRMGYKAH